MQKCRKCNKPIKFVATSINTSVMCDAEKLQFVTDNGRILEGYLIHKCETENKENGSR